MTPNAVPPDESARLALLSASKLLDSEVDPAFDALVRLLLVQTDCPVAMINLIDSHRLWAMARVGIEQRQFSRLDAFCAEVIAQGDALVVHDAPTDPRFKHNAWVTGAPHARFYAGVPLMVQGQALGTVCVLSPTPTDLSTPQWQGLKDIALAASALVEARLSTQRFRKLEARVRTASLAGSDWLWETNDQGVIQWVSASLMQHTGLNPSTEIGLKAKDLYLPRDDDTRASWDRFLAARARREPFSNAIADRMTPRGMITVSISGTPVFNQAGRFMGYRGASSNITRQINEEQQSRQADLLLRQAIESFNAGVMISGPDGRILLSNSSWRRRMGTDAVEGTLWPDLLRKRIAEGVYPDAVGREDDFFEWRMGMVNLAEPQEIRLNNAWVLSNDQRLPDGSIVHFSIGISETKRHAAALAVQQKALEESKARLNSVLLALPDLWFVIDGEGRFEAAHEEHALLVRPFSELKGKPFGAGVPPELAEREAQAMAKAHATGQSQRLDYSLELDGGLKHFEARLTPMPDQHTLFLTRDMTERMVAAEKLRVSEELYRSVASSISDGLIVVQLDGRVVAINQAGCRILGVQSAELVNVSTQEALAYQLLTDDLQSVLPREQWPVIATIRTGERQVAKVHPLRRRDGDIAWVQISSHMLRVNAQAQPFAVVATFRDITQERQAAQALALSEERWKFALDGAGDGVWDWDAAADRIFYSQRWKAMLGHEDLDIGDQVSELTDRIHPDDRAPVVAALNAYLAQDQGLFQAEFRMRHKLGHDVWILSRGKIVSRDAMGRPVRVVGTHSDITPIKRAEQVLREKQSAEAASAAKSEFLSRMSHEIRTPLNAVNGFAQLLKLQLSHTPGASQHISFVDQILHGSQHLMALVNDVLDLQKVEAGILTLKAEPLALLGEVQQCVAMLGPLASQRGIALQIDVDPGYQVHADRQRLRQILMNIGSNAIKYNQAGGTVWFDTALREDGGLALIIRDTGPGMSPQQLGRLFQPFERLGRETSSIEGSGLGLIITRSLIEAMGGSMEIRSQPGSGTRVNIVMPAAAHGHMPEAGDTLNTHMDKPDGGRSAANQHRETSRAEQAPLHVLYVEDNRINAMLFEEALRPYPQLSLEIAEDGQMALSMARDKAPDVLVLDAHLPGMSGFDVLRALRTLPLLENTPAFMCSADAMPDDVARATAAGFAGYWTKPIDIQQVTSVLCKLADRGDNAAP
ncbi:MAG: PAS domain S-box protein [Rubrivivax sp.]|nr:MAG: PAS domain S-box protein [Rubrivivax sp.]